MIKCSKIPAIFNWFPDICYPRCLPDYWQWTFKISSSYNEVVPFVKIKYSKYSRMSQVIFCGRQPLKIFTWRILKYFLIWSFKEGWVALFSFANMTSNHWHVKKSENIFFILFKTTLHCMQWTRIRLPLYFHGHA